MGKTYKRNSDNNHFSARDFDRFKKSKKFKKLKKKVGKKPLPAIIKDDPISDENII
jgi:hypothetical protein